MDSVIAILGWIGLIGSALALAGTIYVTVTDPLKAPQMRPMMILMSVVLLVSIANVFLW